MRYLALLALIQIPVFAQKAEAGQPVLDTLLAEVRQLRLAIERSTLLGARTQLALSRLQIDEATAARISQQLNDVRREAVSLTAKRAELSEQIKEMESRMPVQDLSRDLQLQLKQSKIELEEITATEQERSTRESDLAGQFQAIQNQLAESRARISEMERSLDAAIQQLIQPH